MVAVDQVSTDLWARAGTRWRWVLTGSVQSEKRPNWTKDIRAGSHACMTDHRAGYIHHWAKLPKPSAADRTVDSLKIGRLPI